MRNLLSIEELTCADIKKILAAAGPMKKERGHHRKQMLAGQTWAMIFAKSSTRTRGSFEVGIRELGGQALFFSSNDSHLARGEPLTGTARELARMGHGAIIRTFAQSDVDD